MQWPPSTTSLSTRPRAQWSVPNTHTSPSVRHLTVCACVCTHPVCRICLCNLPSACPSVTTVLLKLLLGSSMDAVLEATRVFGNLSQIKDVRRFVMQHKGVRRSLPLLLSSDPQSLTPALCFFVSVEQFVITLLDSKSPDVCFSACGVLINLSADPDNRAMLSAEGAVQK